MNDSINDDDDKKDQIDDDDAAKTTVLTMSLTLTMIDIRRLVLLSTKR